MESKPYDIVLLPEPALVEKAIQVSQRVKRHGTHFTLGTDDHFSHVSLYMLQLNTDGLRNTKVILEEIAKDTEIIEGRADKYHYEKGYFDIEYQKTTELINLQNTVVEQLNPIRDGLRAKDEKRLHTASGEERTNIEQYGYRSVGNLFAPHLTFTRFKDTQVNSLSDLPPEDSFDGSFVALAIFEMGDHGTCRWRVDEWGLGQQNL